jgi:hypothetical protein
LLDRVRLPQDFDARGIPGCPSARGGAGEGRL